VTHEADQDGDVIDLYAHSRARIFEPIPVSIRTSKPPRRKRNQEQA
jgi:hypothetical protein